MQDYLVLVPEAGDAKAAREKLVIWQDKLEHPDIAAESSTGETAENGESGKKAVKKKAVKASSR